ncbi:response regulator receiver protein, partial [Actinomadura bangladeshensis]|nr:response regulator receiver protein [Actinomadura bangladeshensis]
MSSGIDADLALDAAVVLSLGMNRVLGRGAGLAGRGAEALAALAAGRAEA